MVWPAPVKPSVVQTLDTFILFVCTATLFHSRGLLYGSIHCTSPQPVISSICAAVNSVRICSPSATITAAPVNASIFCTTASRSPPENSNTR